MHAVTIMSVINQVKLGGYIDTDIEIDLERMGIVLLHCCDFLYSIKVNPNFNVCQQCA